MDPIDPALMLLRAGHMAALCMGFGTVLAKILLIRDHPAPAMRGGGRLTGLTTAAFAAALLTLLPWVALQCAVMADWPIASVFPGAVWVLLTRTGFGHAIVIRAGLLALALCLSCIGRGRLALLPAALALAIQAAIGHAAEQGAILVAEALHVLAAGAWLGSLPALWVLLKEPDAARVAQRFSGLGLAAVVVVAGSALALASAQLGSLGGLFDTGYGWVILVKCGLFAALLALAACNRLVLTPRLAAGANRWLRASVMAEIVLGLVLLAAAAWLAALPPAWQQSSADHSRPFLEVPNAESV